MKPFLSQALLIAASCTILISPSTGKSPRLVVYFHSKVPLISAQSSSCLQCTSESPGCDEGTLPVATCPQQDDSCFSRTITSGFELQRGCVSSLAEADQQRCRDATDSSCILCSGDGCNRERWHKCHQCSRTTNNRCYAAPRRVLFCRHYRDGNGCFAKLVGDNLIRGCQSDPEEAQNPCAKNKYCVSCTGEACNDQSFDDLKAVTRCIQCKEGEFRCVAGNPANSECDEREDRCYIKMWKEGELDRGCVKKLSEEEQIRCNDESDRSCYSSSGKQCNTHRWLKCFHCSPGENPPCEEEQTNTTLSSYCANFQLNDACYAKMDNFKVTRGCVSDLGSYADPCEGNPKCLKCSSDGCNSMSEAYIKDAPNQKRLLKNASQWLWKNDY
ncbi:uncharacterized protein LOC128735186 [Sabethes cyaneus]|uniref:uncharacterized protein LOC128735186 n=1 Tax=Sabethes cyaneus TaxID=53552 RepID=UPI00237D98CA|nr:uncharacterized protein LOC128735186 [Sabethes cyaneus]